MTITAELSSLVPGSLVIEAHRLTGMLYLHVLDLDAAGGADKVRQDALDLEARVLRAFASNDDLRAAGSTSTRARDASLPVRRRRAAVACPAPGPDRPTGGEAMIVVVLICAVLLASAAALAVVRAEKGPSMLDRTIALDVFTTTLVGTIALEAAWSRRTETIPILVVLSLVGFVGSVTIARFASVEPEGEGGSRPARRSRWRRPSGSRLRRSSGTWPSIQSTGRSTSPTTTSLLRRPSWTVPPDLRRRAHELDRGGRRPGRDLPPERGLPRVRGGVGVVRFPDLLARMHAATKPQVLGLILVLIALALRLRSWRPWGCSHSWWPSSS
ncbi:monovalent cation/H+ antiporter complex subunit F [Oerskovia sp. M15]